MKNEKKGKVIQLWRAKLGVEREGLVLMEDQETLTSKNPQQSDPIRTINRVNRLMKKLKEQRDE